MREEMPELDWPAMGRYLYMAKFPWWFRQMRCFLPYLLDEHA